jgi:alkanesulfonate monooxygenase SsuD/methylene tetrahydromethanopterin reductase-like flavin-dependent oxidoreductase (luciferase family)
LRLSLAFDGSTPIRDTLPLVLEAEELGLDGVWSAEHVGLNDAVVPSAHYLGVTERLDVGIVGPGTDTRHPGMLAMELNSLEQLGPGRVRIQVGTGDPHLARRIGAGSRSKSLENVESLVASLRALMGGETVTRKAPAFELDRLRLYQTTGSPGIDVMAIRPRMLELAARVGDGVALSFGASLSYLNRVVKETEEHLDRLGRDRKTFRITAASVGVVDTDLAAAQAHAAKFLAFSHVPTAEVLAEGEVPLPDQQVLTAAMETSGPAAAAELFSDETVDALTIATTPESFADRIAEYEATGIDELAITLAGNPARHMLLLKQLSAMGAGR